LQEAEKREVGLQRSLSGLDEQLLMSAKVNEKLRAKLTSSGQESQVGSKTDYGNKEEPNQIDLEIKETLQAISVRIFVRFLNKQILLWHRNAVKPSSKRN
jgi:hypothetical protein